MTTQMVRQCDFCGRKEAPEPPDADTWGVIETTTPLGHKRRDDCCRGCLSLVRGWQNPYVAGTARRVREVPPVANAGFLPLGRRVREVHLDGTPL